MKNYILSNISMKDILYKYGIRLNKDMFSCPFHGKDRKPSAKAYDNTFHCFACGLTGDTIKFVEKYFNLSFKESMQKINEDFHLGLDSTTKIDYNKINEIKQERLRKEHAKEMLLKEFRDSYTIRDILKKERALILDNINIHNINFMLTLECEIRDAQWLIEDKINILEKKMATIM